jgi:putative heme-binding domain-containing protein
MSDTDESITIRNVEGIDQVIIKRDLDELTKSPVSLMPADLQKTMSEQDLVDVVEYMTTLKKAS